MRVIIADDHSLFRDGIASLLDAEGFDIVAQVGDGESAVEEVFRLEPDLVLMDIFMPGIDGIEALKQIKSQCPEMKVIVITASEDETFLQDAMIAGADGYLQKSINTDGLIAGIKGAVRGELALSRQSASDLIRYLVSNVRVPAKDEIELNLREKRILKLVCEGLSNKAIALNLSISESTVKYHLTRLMKKLEVQNRTEAATWAIRSGYLENCEDI